MSRTARPVQDLIDKPRIVDGRAGADLDPRFSAWLETRLHTIYDRIATEPLPDDLLALVHKLKDSTPRG